MPISVLSIAQMREWEAATWATGQTEAEVIRRVGSWVARRALQLTEAGDRILILAGKGHNGDDVRAARQFLTDRQITILDVLAPETDLPHVEKALREKPALVIDGLFGIGLSRALAEAWQQIIAAVNNAKIPVLAVDVPSGLNADTGEIFDACIQADVTLTVGAPKTGMLTATAWPYVGRVEVADDVGLLLPCPLSSELKWTLPQDFLDFPPRRAVAGHKGSYGHVSILAGSLGYHGAAVLATRAAQRAQPGLVTVFVQEDIYYPVAGQLQAAMVSLWQTDSKKMAADFDALLVGPGLAGLHNHTELRLALRHWWRDYEKPVVVDASALDLLAGDIFDKNYIRVVTPHPGEAARLLKWTTQRIQSERVRALREISKKFSGCWVVLKGNETLIGCAEGDIYVNPSGNPHLGQGGSGDLLSGFIAGLLAQPELQKDVAKTLRYAVWEHGAAADTLQADRANWTVEDLAVEIGNAR